MKSILFIACLVLVQGAPDAEPEADPYFYYNSGVNYPATAYHHGVPHTAALVPKLVSPLTAAVTPFANTIHTPLVHQAVVKDVEVTPAEVKKEVTPLAHTFVSPYNVGFRYGTYGLPYTTGAYHYPAATYAAAPSYVANSGGAVHIVNKREADAEPEADPFLYYNTPATTYHHGFPHPAAVAPAIAAVGAFPTTFANAIHTPFVHQAVVKEVEETPAEVKKEVTPLTKTFISPYNVGLGYGNYGFPYNTGGYQYPLATYATSPLATVSAVRDAASPSYVANSGGAVHIVNKREADPEADAYHYYGNPGHHYGYGYGHYGYGHRYGYRRAYSGYYGYPYGYNRW
jgi:hypothetical protein